MFLQMYRSHHNCSHIISIYSKVEPVPKEKGNLYLGGVAAFNKSKLKQEFGIDCVLSIIDKWAYDQFKVGSMIEKHEIKHHKWINLEDVQDQHIYPHLEEAHAYLKTNLENRNVYVHCQMGMSRSSTLVIAFLMKEYGMSYNTARALTKSKRQIVCPNQGFESDLLKFQEYLVKIHPNIHKN